MNNNMNINVSRVIQRQSPQLNTRVYLLPLSLKQIKPPLHRDSAKPYQSKTRCKHQSYGKIVKRKRSFVCGVKQRIDKLCESLQRKKEEEANAMATLRRRSADPKIKALGEYTQSRAKGLEELFEKMRLENTSPLYNESEQQQSDGQSRSSSSSLSAEEEEKLCERLRQDICLSSTPGMDGEFA
ncbi:hypothetical protein TKK_0018549 [Trichogramma kaykai]|uniref:Uncharacterized protein n=1 Tax=Trichogramma kaykai TaxID=54128 RepID=A0ABD2VZ08_9HYME